MSDTVPTINAAQPPTERVVHPFRGVLWGLLFGIGLAGLLVSLKVVSLSLVTMIVVVVLGTIAGVAWSVLGPARLPAGAPPVRQTQLPTPETSRFDDFTDPMPAQSEPTAAPESGGPNGAPGR